MRALAIAQLRTGEAPSSPILSDNNRVAGLFSNDTPIFPTTRRFRTVNRARRRVSSHNHRRRRDRRRDDPHF